METRDPRINGSPIAFVPYDPWPLSFSSFLRSAMVDPFGANGEKGKVFREKFRGFRPRCFSLVTPRASRFFLFSYPSLSCRFIFHLYSRPERVIRKVCKWFHGGREAIEPRWGTLWFFEFSDIVDYHEVPSITDEFQREYSIMLDSRKRRCLLIIDSFASNNC